MFEVFEKLESTSGRNDKIALLKKYDAPTLRNLLELALDPYRVFNITKWPAVEYKSQWSPETGYAQFLLLLDRLETRRVTGNAAREATRQFFEMCSPLEGKWYSRILTKDLRVGVDFSTVDKAMGRFIARFAIQLCHPFEERKMRIPTWASTKLDGMRIVAKKQAGVVKLYSRKGNEINTLPHINEALLQLPGEWCVDAEGYTLYPGDFQKLIGIIKRDDVSEDSNLIHLFAFDYIPLHDWDMGSCPLPFEERQKLLNNLIPDDHPILHKVGHKLVHSMSELKTLSHEMFAKGYEGLVCKPPKSPYSFKRADWMKIKPINDHEFCDDAEFCIVGAEEGRGDLVGKLGAFVVQGIAKEGLPVVQFNVGTGFKDHERAQWWQELDTLIGKQITVRFMGTSIEGTPRHPVFKSFRDGF